MGLPFAKDEGERGHPVAERFDRDSAEADGLAGALVERELARLLGEAAQHGLEPAGRELLGVPEGLGLVGGAAGRVLDGGAVALDELGPGAVDAADPPAVEGDREALGEGVGDGHAPHRGAAGAVEGEPHLGRGGAELELAGGIGEALGRGEDGAVRGAESSSQASLGAPHDALVGLDGVEERGALGPCPA